MLEGVSAKESVFVPGSPGRNWMSVSSGGDFAGVAKRVRISPEFAAKVYEALKPGATIIVTDEPVVRKQNKDFTILAD
jgi:hypothetical protein